MPEADIGDDAVREARRDAAGHERVSAGRGREPAEASQRLAGPVGPGLGDVGVVGLEDLVGLEDVDEP